MDMEYEEHYKQQQKYIIPEVIRKFLIHFQTVVNEQNVHEIHNDYETGWVFEHQFYS